MSDEWTQALQEAYASAPADQVVLDCLELIHPAFVDRDDNQDSVRIAIDDQSWVLEHESSAPLFAGQSKRYEPLAVNVKLPEQAEGTLGSLEITLDNVPRTVWPKLQAAAKVRASAMLIYRQWVGSKSLETGVCTFSGPPDLIIGNLTMNVVKATQLQLTGTAAFVDLLSKGFPRRTFDRDGFPGLHGVSA